MVKLANSSLTNNHDPDGCPRVGLFARLSAPAFIAPSAGIISQVVLPVGVMVQFIWRPTIAMSCIGIIGAAIIGFIIRPSSWASGSSASLGSWSVSRQRVRRNSMFRILEIKCIAATDNNGIFRPFASSNKTTAPHEGASALSMITEEFLVSR